MSTETPRVQVMENGPLLVFGDVPLVSREIILSEDGDKLSWTTGVALSQPPKSPYALCRCGQSSNKPFCDGTHSAIDFDGTESAPTNTFSDRAERYEGTGMTLLDDKASCIHAGFCGAGGTYVWSLMEKTDHAGTRALAMAMTERCPSGRLSYEAPGAPDAVEPSLPLQVVLVPDGPIWLTGGIPVERSDGKPFETRNRTTLCRCGASATKPLCDGAHADVGFEG